MKILVKAYFRNIEAHIPCWWVDTTTPNREYDSFAVVIAPNGNVSFIPENDITVIDPDYVDTDEAKKVAGCKIQTPKYIKEIK